LIKRFQQLITFHKNYTDNALHNYEKVIELTKRSMSVA